MQIVTETTHTVTAREQSQWSSRWDNKPRRRYKHDVLARFVTLAEAEAALVSATATWNAHGRAVSEARNALEAAEADRRAAWLATLEGLQTLPASDGEAQGVSPERLAQKGHPNPLSEKDQANG
jgi:hypothetical protein